MKNIIKTSVVIFLTLSAFLYLAISFVNIEISFIKWSERERMFFVIFTFINVLISVITSGNIDYCKKEKQILIKEKQIK